MAAKVSFRPRLVKYDHADQNLLLNLVGFAVSIIATRYFLELTGYPQVASGDFHIAHVLWGGLLLYVAALLLLTWRGRSLQRISSVLTGVGFGLFIDEIGKFITKSNDYFYPLAAPLIYAFFLLSVFVYKWVQKSRTGDSRVEVYRVLDILEQGVSPDVTAQTHRRMRASLSQIAAESTHPKTARLAEHALAILEGEDYLPSSLQPALSERWLEGLRQIEARWIGQNRLRAALILGFFFLSLRGLLVAILMPVVIVEISEQNGWQQLIAAFRTGSEQIIPPRLVLFGTVMVFEALIGILLLAVTVFLAARRLRRGLELGYWVLLFSLTALHLPVFYLEQFEILALTLLQFSLLLGVIRYRALYVFV